MDKEARIIELMKISANLTLAQCVLEAGKSDEEKSKKSIAITDMELIDSRFAQHFYAVEKRVRKWASQELTD
jgi:hypothetical protein